MNAKVLQPPVSRPIPPEEFSGDWSPSIHLRDGLGRCLARMEAGQTGTVVFLGGSITAHDGWRVHTERWFAETFPDTPLRMVNAGFGGTGSSLAAFRLERDVLCHRPDLVFVEFAVNDMDHPDHDLTLRGMESVIRRLRQDLPEADVCLVYTVSHPMLRLLLDGKTPPTIAIMEKLAVHYQIPSVNFATAVLAAYRNGDFVFHESEPTDFRTKNQLVFTTDHTHPTDFGHAFYAAVLRSALLQARSDSSMERRNLPAPLHPALWMEGRLIPWDQLELSPEWERVPESGLAATIHNRPKLDELWATRTPGACAQLSFTGDAVGFFGVFGRESGIFDWNLDGGETISRPLFDRYGSMLRAHYHLTFLDLTRARHTVQLTLSARHPDRTAMLALKNQAHEAATFPLGLLGCASALLINGTTS